MRTGLLGASAAVAVGVVAIASGLVPGAGPRYTVAESHQSGLVPADGASDLATQGAPSSHVPSTGRTTTPRDRGDSTSPRPSRTARASASPSGSPTPSSVPSSSASDDGGSPSGGQPGSSSPGPGNTAGGETDPETAAEARVLELVNEERSTAGCEPLTRDAKLADLAGDHSADMAARDYFSHTTPDGKSPWDRAEAAGIEDMGGENIARGQSDAEAVMDAWMDSSGHRANILNCEFQTLGVGSHFAQGGPWWTQNFGY